MTTRAEPMVDQAELEALVGRVIGDFGGVASAALALVGDRLGLYRALADRGPLTSEALAQATRTDQRYIRHWLLNQASAGYVTYDAGTGRYRLTPEQTMVFATEDTPASMLGGFEVLGAAMKSEREIAEAIRNGGGMHWGDHDPGLFTGTARFFKPGYIGNLVQSWIPALTGARERLTAGAMVADVGCGYGHSTILMAQAFPTSRFVGFDSHAPSIEAARQAAAEAGVGDRVTFEVATAQNFPGTGYDLVALFDCLHDMGDPQGAATHIRETLAPNGSVLLVEPMAGDTVEENLNPIGRIYSAASVLVCTPHAIAEANNALGTLATDAELREVFTAAGFATFRRATETPTNRVFEARA